MFRENKSHLQGLLFSDLDNLSPKARARLEESWAGVFRREFFFRLDEKPLAVLYSDEYSRPNTPVNVMLGLETLKSAFGWSDQQMHDNFLFDVQVRYALGYDNLGEGDFDLRTQYYFRHNLTDHMQMTGENLVEMAFEQVTDQQLKAFKLKTGKLRMDSTMVMSNIREMSRLQLLVEVLQRIHRVLSVADQQRYAHEFEPFLKGSSGQYIYHIKGEKSIDHIERIGKLMQRLMQELSVQYSDTPAFRILERVFREHFVLEETGLRSKEGKELSASSLQSPDDWEASYRRKRGQDIIGYAANLTETCDPDNGLQLIVKVQVEPNNTDDAAMLEEALPDLKERTDVDEMYTDGGYSSPEVDVAMREHEVVLIQTAIRGRKPSDDKMGLADFDWKTNDDGQPIRTTCPQNQQVDVDPGRKKNCYICHFEETECNKCPFRDKCPTTPLKRKSKRVLRISQQKLDVARRRQRHREERSSGRNLRAAVESTMRSVKHPFRNGKVPVRGKSRVNMVIIGSAAMSNVRRIQRFQASRKKVINENKREKRGPESPGQGQVASFFSSFFAQVRC